MGAENDPSGNENGSDRIICGFVFPREIFRNIQTEKMPFYPPGSIRMQFDPGNKSHTFSIKGRNFIGLSVIGKSKHIISLAGVKINDLFRSIAAVGKFRVRMQVCLENREFFAEKFHFTLFSGFLSLLLLFFSVLYGKFLFFFFTLSRCSRRIRLTS